MSREISFKPYRRAFRRPLRTARGEWALREGFLLRVEQDGQVGYGEVAPIPEFGSETLAEAQAFLQQLQVQADLPVPQDLPCCAFALSSAQVAASADVAASARTRVYPVSGLLPAGDAGLTRARQRVQAGYRNLKWKIGVAPVAQELEWAGQLLDALPPGVRLRFDANAGLNSSELEQWLELLARFPQQTDYIEQPLACGQEASMARYMHDYGVPIALDESLNGDCGARFLEPGAWSGPLVVKAALMGEVGALQQRLLPVAAQLVFSSVFETGIAAESVLALADRLPDLSAPIGFDTVDAFNDTRNHLPAAAAIDTNARAAYVPEQIWNSI
ncbi:o-succinylbenzoate synthase [Coraliomargarita sp. SDUM461003]|uniref:o-succinylbenzoate synthase n=1 Tax=Thalassobacterium maritimum TaxID=3041265 RepID=A0ABU1B1T0_9BACT|nr:o-succinylbenzoate synthase [Coraliomargarita sp. SDUM461003]MDQ8209407.1 o-succinylbenzoate synthase [Coraliomargarita sp. SDUM461003]